MAENPQKSSTSLLNITPISRVRRNHGLEHATLHVLSEHHPKKSMAGHSDMNGFWILGDFSTEDVDVAIQEALQRLRSGERHLAVHPNCGTNFATAGVFAGLAAALAMFGTGPRTRDKLERVPLAVTLATLALVAAQPLGLRVQERVTTSPDPGTLKVVEIRPTRKGRLKAHRIVTED